MTKFKVDLSTRVIAPNSRVFLARAGKDGHLFEAVREAGAIGPDLPDLSLDLQGGLDNDQLIEAKVKRSRAISNWLRTPPSRRGPEPSKNLADFSQLQRRRGFAQIEGIVRSYFSDLKEGDLLVIPNPSPFGEAIVAEAGKLSRFPTLFEGRGRYAGWNYSGRKLGYSVNIRMTRLPRHVIDLAKAPTGFAEIYDPRVKRRIYELAYNDFVIGEDFLSRIVTTKADFRPFDANVLNAFVTMVSENVERLAHFEGEKALLQLVDAAFFKSTDEDLQLKIDINSPGYLAILDRSIVPLVVSAMLSILISVGFDSAAFADDTTVEVVNSRATEALAACDEVGQYAQSMLRLFSSEADFQQTCDLLREAHENTGAHTKVKTSVEE